MVATTTDSPPLLGWLVDPSLEQQEAGLECAIQQKHKWQWRADDFLEVRQEVMKRSTNEQREDLEDVRVSGPSNKNNIFRKLKQKLPGAAGLKKVSSVDAVTDEDATNDYNTTSLMPSMIHLQRTSSRESVECVLADVFHLPSSSSTLTDEEDQFCSSNDSATTIETVVIDEEGLETEYRRIPLNICLSNENAVECIVERSNSLPSTTSSIMTAHDSSDDEQRMADLEFEGREDDEWNSSDAEERDSAEQPREQDLDRVLEEQFLCAPLNFLNNACGEASTNISLLSRQDGIDDISKSIENGANHDNDERDTDDATETGEECPSCASDFSCVEWPITL